MKLLTEKNNMIYMTAEFKVKAGQVEIAKQAIREFVAQVSSEPDTLFYDAYIKPDGVSFVHYFTFRHPAGKEFHSSTPYVKTFTARLYPLCEQEPTFTELELIKSSKL